MVAPKCYWNQFNAEKYSTAQSFKHNFLQNSILVQLCTSARECKCVVNIAGSHFVKAFSAIHRVLNDVSSITKGQFLLFLFQSREWVTSAGTSSGGYGRCCSIVTLLFAKKYLTKTERYAGALS